jgi:2-polyprenyl-3-methyl-5-hydroxy-6-metoxy-1,4-benzoquinol methylase
MVNTDQMNKSFLEEYNSKDAIDKYSHETAGKGVNYLIQHDYGRVYDDAIRVCRETSSAPLRILEYGCGAGMNLIGLVSRLQQQGVQVESAVGADFSEALVASAKQEAKRFLPAPLNAKVSFHVARNETLRRDLARGTGKSEADMTGRFDLILGVNTFRYCHRLGNSDDCANDIFALLRPGGMSVMIDMNDRFPLFRSHLKGTVENAEEAYLPTLDEYTDPFARAGFEIRVKDNFCWIPHSAGPLMTTALRAVGGVLNATVRSRAMRSLVVGRKPR